MMNIGGMDMSPKLGARNLFNNSGNQMPNNAPLFSIGTNSQNSSNINIFGAPTNNANSGFGNNNAFQSNSGGIFPSSGLFSSSSSAPFGFSFGKK